MPPDIDPEKCVFFVQSYGARSIPELAWTFASLAGVGCLERHERKYKEKSEQFRENINAGLFTYPVLQAADILLYKAELVPVGEDQVQHLELSRRDRAPLQQPLWRDLPEPQPVLTPAKRIMALNEPTRKMSKSIPGSFISLSDTEAEMRKKILPRRHGHRPARGHMSPSS